MTRFVFLASLLASLLLSGSPVQAHGVYLFAWAEADRICGEGYFSKKSPVREGQVRLLDDAGRELAQGRTDEQGNFCLPRPAQASDLTLVLEAGQGHRAEFRLGPGGQDGASPAASAPAAALAPPVAAADAEAVRRLVREELQAQLTPLRQALAEALNPSPGPREIIGGLGWLAGLAALAFWLKRKR
jgi:nickel transport protein